MSEQPPKKKARIGTHHGWCFTVHGEAEMTAFKDFCETLAVDDQVNIAVVGDEITGTGGRHAQGFLNFHNGRGIAFGSLKKLLKDAGLEDAHFENRKAKSIDRAGNYCLKEHFEHIAAKFPEKGSVKELYRPGSKPLLVIGWDIENARPDGTGPGRRTDLTAFKESVLAGDCMEYDDAMMNHSGLCARAEGFVRQFIGRFSPVPKMSPSEWKEHLTEFGIRMWQAWAISELANPDKSYRFRKVQVVTDSVLNGTGGNTGKSHFCDWFPRLMANVGQKVQVLGPGKLADMANQLQSDVDIVLIDIPASRSEHLQWSFIEQLKCGRVDSPKYHSCSVRLKNKPVRVMILCNNHPDVTRRPDYDPEERDEYGRKIHKTEFTLSADRWVEYDITSGHDISVVPDYMLPAEFNFGPEFSSDMTGDGPVRWSVTPERIAEINAMWEDSATKWNVKPVHRLAMYYNNGPTSMWIKCDGSTYHPFAKSLDRLFRTDGWNGEGLLEVCIVLPATLTDVHFDESNFTVVCLQKGVVPADTPYGFVSMDSEGRIARIWLDAYGDIVNVTALSHLKSPDLLRQVIVAYAITRSGHVRWRRKGDSGFLENHNGY